MTGLGWLTIIALVIFFALMIVKIVPIYIENYSVKTVLHSLEEEPLITQKSVREVRKIVERRLQINSVYDLDNKVHIEKSSGVLTVDITYEVRKPMFGNIDIIVSFSDKVELVAL
ncbi:MAG: DUF4845 domain-containing protein [Chromatiales bacterium]|jgi:hypothetical protein